MVGVDAARQKSMASEVRAKAEGLTVVDWLRDVYLDRAPQPRVFFYRAAKCFHVSFQHRPRLVPNLYLHLDHVAHGV